jgi:HK97 family phage portal protein
MRIELGGKFPFVSIKSGQLEKQVSLLSDEITQLRASINSPSATLEDFFKAFGWDTNTTAGIVVDKDTAMTLSAVWRAVSILSSSIAQLPVGLYRKEKGGDIKEITDHPGIELLRKPNGLQTGYIFRESMQYNILTWGNGYAFIERDGTFRPTRFEILDPAKIDIEVAGDLLYYVREFTRTEGDFILHVPALSFDGVLGKSPIQVAKESIAGGLATQQFGNKFFASGAKQSGILTHPGRLGDKGTQNLRKSFNKIMKDDEGGTMILEEGLQYHPISIPPDQAQFLDSRKFSVNEVARWYGVPPHLLGDLDRATYSNIEQQSIEFVMYSLMPWIRRWEDELNRKLLTEQEKQDHYFKFNINGLLRGDSKTRFEAYGLALDRGWMNIDEVRALEEMNNIPGGMGKKYLIQVNRTPIDQLGNEKENSGV